MIGALVGRAVTPKLLGGLAIVWAASLALLWAFMAGQAGAAAEAAAAEAKGKAETACAEARAVAAHAETLAIAAAVDAARAKWDAAQAAADLAAAADKARLDADLQRARSRAESLSRQLLGHIRAQPLPADCRLDAERLRLYAEARRGAAASAPGD